MAAQVVPAERIAQAPASELAAILQILLTCTEEAAERLGEQSFAAIAELPDDSRPTTYDSLVDVARFCVEEEPGWTRDQCAELVASFPRLDAVIPTDKRLSDWCAKYERAFPGLRFITTSEARDPAAAAEELQVAAQRLAEGVVHEPSSETWQTELDHLLETMWDVAVDRAGNLTAAPAASAPVDQARVLDSAPTGMADRPVVAAAAPKSVAIPTTEALSEAPEAAASRGVPSATSASSDHTDDVPFLSLASFRALAMASPVLESFFDHDLVGSFRLEPVQRSTSGGAHSWHAAPVAPRGDPLALSSDAKPQASLSASSIASTLLGRSTAVLDATTPASYSRDITPGTRGKVVGFLGGLLGEEGKTKMDALADQVGLRLQTHSVKGPLPSFAKPLEQAEAPKTGLWRNGVFRGASAAVNAAAESKPSLGGRLAGALRLSAPARQSTASEQVPLSNSADDKGTTTELQSNASQDVVPDSALATMGPEAAVESLRAANEALVQERDTFVIDEVQQSAHDTTADLDDDIVSDWDDFDSLDTSDRNDATGLQGEAARKAQGMDTHGETGTSSAKFAQPAELMSSSISRDRGRASSGVKPAQAAATHDHTFDRILKGRGNELEMGAGHQSNTPDTAEPYSSSISSLSSMPDQHSVQALSAPTTPQFELAHTYPELSETGHGFNMLSPPMIPMGRPAVIPPRRSSSTGTPAYNGSARGLQQKRLNWADMICHTIAGSPLGRMVIQELFEGLCQNYPDVYEWATGRDWEARVKNRIKSTLSIKSHLFAKVPRPTQAGGKGSWWTLTPEAQDALHQGRISEIVRGPSSLPQSTQRQGASSTTNHETLVHRLKGLSARRGSENFRRGMQRGHTVSTWEGTDSNAYAWPYDDGMNFAAQPVLPVTSPTFLQLDADAQISHSPLDLNGSAMHELLGETGTQKNTFSAPVTPASAFLASSEYPVTQPSSNVPILMPEFTASPAATTLNMAPNGSSDVPIAPKASMDSSELSFESLLTSRVLSPSISTPNLGSQTQTACSSCLTRHHTVGDTPMQQFMPNFDQRKEFRENELHQQAMMLMLASGAQMTTPVRLSMEHPTLSTSLPATVDHFSGGVSNSVLSQTHPHSFDSGVSQQLGLSQSDYMDRPSFDTGVPFSASSTVPFLNNASQEQLGQAPGSTGFMMEPTSSQYLASDESRPGLHFLDRNAWNYDTS